MKVGDWAIVVKCPMHKVPLVHSRPGWVEWQCRCHWVGTTVRVIETSPEPEITLVRVKSESVLNKICVVDTDDLVPIPKPQGE